MKYVFLNTLISVTVDKNLLLLFSLTCRSQRVCCNGKHVDTLYPVYDDLMMRQYHTTYYTTGFMCTKCVYQSGAGNVDYLVMVTVHCT